MRTWLSLWPMSCIQGFVYASHFLHAMLIAVSRYRIENIRNFLLSLFLRQHL
jgi:hypothetical protein